MRPLLLAALALPLAGAEPPDALNRLLATGRYEAALAMMPRLQDLDEPSESGRTPLTVAADSSSNDAYDMVHALLSLGADPDAPDGAGLTPLHYAAGAGVLSVVHLLVDRFGAEPDVSAGGETPIMLAARKGRPRIVRFLESRGARLPEAMGFEFRLDVATESHFQELISGEWADETIPFRHFRAQAQAELRAQRELGAPPLMLEWQEETVRVMEELAADPAWQGRSNFDLSTEANRAGHRLVADKPGFREQYDSWMARREGMSE